MSVKIKSTVAKLSDAIGAREICGKYRFNFSIDVCSAGENPATGTLRISGQNWPAAVRQDPVPADDNDCDEESRFNALAALYEQKGEQGLVDLLRDLAACLETPLTIQATEHDFDEFHTAQEWNVQPGATDIEIKTIMAIDDDRAAGPQSAGPDDDESAQKRTARYFGMRLEAMRQRAGLSRQELARRAGLFPATLANLERGSRLPSAEMQRTLEGILDCSFDERPHRTATVQVGDWKAEIDEGIVPLIQEIWRAGIETSMSCQENSDGYIWIEFPEVEDAEAFLNVVAPYEDGPDTLYSRMLPCLVNHGPISDWSYRAYVYDFALRDRELDGISYNPPAYFHFFISINFQPDDLPAVLNRLRAHNERIAQRRLLVGENDVVGVGAEADDDRRTPASSKEKLPSNGMPEAGGEIEN